MIGWLHECQSSNNEDMVCTKQQQITLKRWPCKHSWGLTVCTPEYINTSKQTQAHPVTHTRTRTHTRVHADLGKQLMD